MFIAGAPYSSEHTVRTRRYHNAGFSRLLFHLAHARASRHFPARRLRVPAFDRMVFVARLTTHSRAVTLFVVLFTSSRLLPRQRARCPLLDARFDTRHGWHVQDAPPRWTTLPRTLLDVGLLRLLPYTGRAARLNGALFFITFYSSVILQTGMVMRIPARAAPFPCEHPTTPPPSPPACSGAHPTTAHQFRLFSLLLLRTFPSPAWRLQLPSHPAPTSPVPPQLQRFPSLPAFAFAVCTRCAGRGRRRATRAGVFETPWRTAVPSLATFALTVRCAALTGV